MRLEMGTFPVKDVTFGTPTRLVDGVLYIDRKELISQVTRDPLIATVDIELAKPGESVRIWPVRDVIEPRAKVEGPGVVYPGICGRPIDTVGTGRTNRLAGVGVVEVSNVNWHDSGGDYVEMFVDMRGPWADALRHLSSLQNVCVVVEPDPALDVHTRNYVVHNACLAVSDRLAAATDGLEPPLRETFDLSDVKPGLPNVVYIWCVHSPQGKSGSAKTFCTSTYGLTQLTPPWFLHPNEVLDGALTGPYRTTFANSWTVANNPVLLELYRRHGVDFNFLGILLFRTEWTSQHEKQLMANQVAKTAKLLGADGVLVTWDAGGNEFMEVIRSVQACERLGIKTVFLTSEGEGTGGVPTLLEPMVEADAMVSSGSMGSGPLGLGLLPEVERVIGNPQMVAGAMREQLVPTHGHVEPPRRYDDHYGFTYLGCADF